MESARRILKSLMAFCVLLGISVNSQAQSPQFKLRKDLDKHVHGEQCASQTVHEIKMQNDPVYAEAFRNAEEMVEAHLKSGNNNRSGQVYTIPIVVHVIHTGEAIGSGTNISDEQVQSAIDALNEDFRKELGTNGFGNGVDVEFEFCLAIRDPQGNATNGINRVNGSSVPNYANEGIGIGQGSGASESAVKSLSHWPASDYYNIWIVNEIEDNDGGAGIQGFAYFPNGTLVDGTVILFNAFGTVGNLKSYTSLNRVTTHEIGHAFSLYHTFQGGTCTESNCATQGDRVCDTPPTVLSSSCNNPACSGTQMVDNYMDYTSETCQNMFTQGQKDRMRASLETQRASLLNSLACVPVTSVDASTNSINSPAGSLCATTFEPEITIGNFGSQTITSLEINYYVDSENSNTYNWTGSLGTAETQTITLPAITSTVGSHTLHVFTENPNGSTDENQSNDIASVPFDIVDGETIEVNITLDNYGEDNTWEITDASGAVVASGGPYANFNLGQENQIDVCLVEGCYDFTIYDAFGDGMCCQYGFGAFEVVLPDGTVAVSGGTFTDSATENFCLNSGGSTGQAPVSNFAANQTTTCEGTNINFTDQSNFNPTSWNWIFEGGSPSTSTQENPNNISYTSPGTYAVTLEVSNANGTDTEVKSGFITITNQPVLSGTIINESCFESNDASIDLQIQHWTPGMTYSWSNGFNGPDPSGLSAGVHTVNIEDNAGCTAMASFTINSPDQINVDLVSAENVSCNGLSNGSIEVDVTGGVSGYSLSWNDPDNQNGTIATNLSAGTYHVVVTDANDCSYTEGFIINEPSPILPTKVFSQADSCAQGIGSAQIDVVGGTPGYEIVWNDPLNTTGNTLVNALAGQYEALITDQNNCTKTASVWIDEISCGGTAVGISDFGASSTMVCAGNSINFTDQSDFEGTSWNWTFEGGTPETSTDQNPTNIVYSVPGTYYVSLEVSNADGSDAEVKNAFITVTNAPTLNGSITNASCFDSEDGNIDLELSGAASGVTYNWSNGFTGQDPDGLGAGEYTVTLIDGAGCNATATYTVGSPEDIYIETVFSQPDSCELGTGMVEVVIFGGTPNYDIVWNDNSNQTGTILSNVVTGEYEGNITDGSGCEKTVTVYVEDINCDGTVGINDQLPFNEISIFPNPLSDDFMTIDFGTLNIKNCEFTIYDMSGKKIISESTTELNEKHQLNLSNFSSGIYLLNISTDIGSYSERLIIKRD